MYSSRYSAVTPYACLSACQDVRLIVAQVCIVGGNMTRLRCPHCIPPRRRRLSQVVRNGVHLASTPCGGLFLAAPSQLCDN